MGTVWMICGDSLGVFKKKYINNKLNFMVSLLYGVHGSIQEKEFL